MFCSIYSWGRKTGSSFKTTRSLHHHPPSSEFTKLLSLTQQVLSHAKINLYLNHWHVVKHGWSNTDCIGRSLSSLLNAYYTFKWPSYWYICHVIFKGPIMSDLGTQQVKFQSRFLKKMELESSLFLLWPWADTHIHSDNCSINDTLYTGLVFQCSSNPSIHEA